ncbi:unnamed protein product [Bursaphelenchus okinawaensis]|uniref:ShKT domain-containing protein n=1 Tax=Bursaphelenchus okinawaensis TaxID=465554 RepID=A0A811LTY9_9BILA|nr:unnamed protein product [Bursaphelenchus okinawaensis]CAG9128000.1 unnamed protein product [Bursaphelenchus okinawaensis]
MRLLIFCLFLPYSISAKVNSLYVRVPRNVPIGIENTLLGANRVPPANDDASNNNPQIALRSEQFRPIDELVFNEIKFVKTEDEESFEEDFSKNVMDIDPSSMNAAEVEYDAKVEGLLNGGTDGVDHGTEGYDTEGNGIEETSTEAKKFGKVQHSTSTKVPDTVKDSTKAHKFDSDVHSTSTKDFDTVKDNTEANKFDGDEHISSTKGSDTVKNSTKAKKFGKAQRSTSTKGFDTEETSTKAKKFGRDGHSTSIESFDTVKDYTEANKLDTEEYSTTTPFFLTERSGIVTDTSKSTNAAPSRFVIKAQIEHHDVQNSTTKKVNSAKERLQSISVGLHSATKEPESTTERPDSNTTRPDSTKTTSDSTTENVDSAKRNVYSIRTTIDIDRTAKNLDSTIKATHGTTKQPVLTTVDVDGPAEVTDYTVDSKDSTKNRIESTTPAPLKKLRATEISKVSIGEGAKIDKVIFLNSTSTKAQNEVKNQTKDNTTEKATECLSDCMFIATLVANRSTDNMFRDTCRSYAKVSHCLNRCPSSFDYDSKELVKRCSMNSNHAWRNFNQCYKRYTNESVNDCSKWCDKQLDWSDNKERVNTLCTKTQCVTSCVRKYLNNRCDGGGDALDKIVYSPFDSFRQNKNIRSIFDESVGRLPSKCQLFFTITDRPHDTPRIRKKRVL